MVFLLASEATPGDGLNVDLYLCKTADACCMADFQIKIGQFFLKFLILFLSHVCAITQMASCGTISNETATTPTRLGSRKGTDKAYPRAALTTATVLKRSRTTTRGRVHSKTILRRFFSEYNVKSQ